MGSYTSAFSRLGQLPAIFTGTDINMLFGWSSAISASYVAQWRKKEMIKALGGRSGVYFNLVVQREVDWEEGLRRVYPRAVKVGIDVLREAGWTTQIPARPEVAIPDDCAAYDIEAFDLQPRGRRWFDQVGPGVVNDGAGMLRLRPEWALADMIYRGKDHRYKTAWMLAPDDLELDEAAESPQMAAALEAMGLSAEDVTEDGYDAIFEELLEWRYQQTGHPTPLEREPVARRRGRPSERG